MSGQPIDLDDQDLAPVTGGTTSIAEMHLNPTQQAAFAAAQQAKALSDAMSSAAIDVSHAFAALATTDKALISGKLDRHSDQAQNAYGDFSTAVTNTITNLQQHGASADAIEKMIASTFVSTMTTTGRGAVSSVDAMTTVANDIHQLAGHGSVPGSFEQVLDGMLSKMSNNRGSDGQLGMPLSQTASAQLASSDSIRNFVDELAQMTSVAAGLKPAKIDESSLGATPAAWSKLKNS